MAFESVSIQQTPPTDHFITLNGLRLHYVDWGGDAARDTLLLLHGGAANTHWWDYVAPHLTELGRVLALDFRGHGRSQWTSLEHYGPRGYVEDTEALIDQLGTRVILGGHSMGAMVAVWVATRRPEWLKMLLVLDSPGTPPSLWRRLQWNWRRRAQGGTRPEMASRDEVLRRFHLVPGPSTVSREILTDLALKSSEQLPNGRWAFRFDPQTRAWRRVGAGRLPYPKVRSIHLPTLILRGAQSTILSPRRARLLHRRIAGSVLQEIPNAYHHITLDNPPATTAAIVDFVRARQAAEETGGQIQASQVRVR